MKTKYEWGKLVIKDRRMNKPPKENKSLKSVLEVSTIESVIEAAEMVDYDFSGNSATAAAHVPAAQPLVIPQKPAGHLTREAYKEAEQELFSQWKSYMNTLLSQSWVITPYERNLHVWRQLWFTLEHSDVVVQIVDARNPLLFYTADILKLAPTKAHFLLLNKADLLTPAQQAAWSSYFAEQGLEHLFYSAASSDPAELLSRVAAKGKTVGMVGYPNVGKSSTINSLFQRKIVQTSLTPGKTKSAQTLNLSGTTLCDCPGLVFPSLVTHKQDLVLNGILSLDQTRDIRDCLALIIDRVGIRTLCYLTGVKQFTNDSRLSMSENFLAALKACSGCVEEGKLIKQVIKMYLEGKLRYVHPPPNCLSSTFNQHNHQVPAEYTLDTAVSYTWYRPAAAAQPAASAEQLQTSKKHYLKKGLAKQFKTNQRAARP